MSPHADPVAEGERTMVVCNSCRYCEGFCAVFTAMERRLAFEKNDLTFLANLCHNCSECLYARQYAPPHAFAIDVPRTFAEIRKQSYDEYAWPAPVARLCRVHGAGTAVGLSAVLTGVFLLLARGLSTPSIQRADFYAVVPHHILVGLFGVVCGLAGLSLSVGVGRFWRDGRAHGAPPLSAGAVLDAVRDAATLANLHHDGPDCTQGEESRPPWRRWFHHLTFYGFLLCGASTSVAALYHVVFGWVAPYGYASLPVVLGTVGGAGLSVGTLGLCWVRLRRDPRTADPSQHGFEAGFLTLLLLTGVSGLLLLALRHTDAMPTLLATHLGSVLALCVTMPYGKFVHGLYRTAALIRNAAEARRAEPPAP